MSDLHRPQRAAAGEDVIFSRLLKARGRGQVSGTAAPFLLSHVPVGPTQGGIQMYQLPGVPTFIPIILAGITWAALKSSININRKTVVFFSTHNWELQIFHTESHSPRRHVSSHVLLMQSLPAVYTILWRGFSIVTSGLLIFLPADWAQHYIQSPVYLLKLLFSGCFIYLHFLQAAKVLLNDWTLS